MTLKQACEEYSSDAVRFALADAGDGLDDANFAVDTANAAIIKLTNELWWMEEVKANESTFREGPPSSYADRVFENEMNYAVKITDENYKDFMFRRALKTGFYDLQTARNEYKSRCGSSGMNRDLVWRFMVVQTQLIAPICPHYAEHVWRDVLNKEGFVIKARWPEAENPDLTLLKADRYLQDLIKNSRNKFLTRKASGGSKKKNKETMIQQSEKTITSGLIIYVNEEYDGWRKECLNIIRDKFDSQTRTFVDDHEILQALHKSEVGQGQIENFKEECMKFLKAKKPDVMNFGVQALDVRLPFGEIEVLEENVELIKRQIGDLEHVEIVSVTDPDAVIKAGCHAFLLKKDPPLPGSPTPIFLH
ncbi:leucine--tRNA ligase, cytoplasmic-like [Rutidosis leptorrhynchoides]|uniref:leucine--tRNA ligase, cytoplasmic-like n=1 Tax=Rutidosis leptorrhynchoides TaxID=125765 RepID=UPI003A9A65A5